MVGVLSMIIGLLWYPRGLMVFWGHSLRSSSRLPTVEDQHGFARERSEINLADEIQRGECERSRVIEPCL